MPEAPNTTFDLQSFHFGCATIKRHDAAPCLLTAHAHVGGFEIAAADCVVDEEGYEQASMAKCNLPDDFQAVEEVTFTVQSMHGSSIIALLDDLSYTTFALVQEKGLEKRCDVHWFSGKFCD